VKDVIERLKDRNPGFNGTADIKMENGKVVSFGIPTNAVADIGPVRALAHLRSFRAVGQDPGCGRLTDLAPLRGMALEILNCWFNPGIRDFGPLRGMKLAPLDADGAAVGALDDRVGMPLVFLVIDRTRIRDLAAIRTMPRLKQLHFVGCAVEDYDPLLAPKLTTVKCDVRPGSAEDVLRKHPTIPGQCSASRCRDRGRGRAPDPPVPLGCGEVPPAARRTLEALRPRSRLSASPLSTMRTQ
jgi:hypothetical protein